MATIIMQTDFEREPSSRLKIKDENDRRNLAYLLYELSSLPDFKHMEDRLDQINGRHKTLKKDQSKLIKADDIKTELNGIFAKIKEDYGEQTKLYKNRMDAQDRTPGEKEYLKYFKYWLRKYADGLKESEKG